MHGETPEAAARRHHLEAVLLGYLQTLDVSHWPGGDGLTVEDIVETYPKVAATGRVPDRATLVRLHPDLSDLLDALLPALPPTGRHPGADALGELSPLQLRLKVFQTPAAGREE